MSRVVVFEFDAATWEVLTPLMEAGELPNLSALKAEGASGLLRSIIPRWSPALWTTIYSGKVRSKHGVEGFDATSESVRVKRLWDIAEQAGLKCGVFGTPVCWPPTDKCAFMIPDVLVDRGSETVPPEYSRLQDMYWARRHSMLEYARDLYDLWRIGVRTRHLSRMIWERLLLAARRSGTVEKYWRQRLWWTAIHSDVFLRLYHQHQPDLATFDYQATDTIQHRYWHYYDPERFGIPLVKAEPYRDVLPASYREADRIVGEIRKAAGPDATLVVLSDHGGAPAEGLGQFIEARLEKWVATLGIGRAATPIRLVGEYCLEFHDPSYLAETQRTLEQVHMKESGQRLFRGFAQRDGHLMLYPIRDHIEGNTVVVPGHGEHPFEELFHRLDAEHSGVHHSDGMFIVAGPPIRAGVELEPGSILDVTPNLLVILGLSVAKDMDGRVWEPMFKPSFLAQSPIRFIETYETAQCEEKGVL